MEPQRPGGAMTSSPTGGEPSPEAASPTGMSCCEAPAGFWTDVYGGDVRPRRHGFECPPDALQIGAWCTIVALIVLYFTLHAPFFGTNTFIGVTVPLMVLAALTVLLKLWLSSSSNEEPIVFDAHFRRLSLRDLSMPPPDGKEPCFYCRGFVTLRAKHCSVCDKCIPGFDHHCRWLNTCVGEKNYRPFFAFVCCAISSVLYVFAVDLYVLIDAAKNRSKYESLLQERYHTSNYAAYMAFLVITLVYTTVGALSMGNLLQFHVYLWWTNQSTYEWIVKKKEEKRRQGTYVSTAGQEPAKTGCCGLKKRRFFKRRPAASDGSPSGHHQPDQQMDPVLLPSGGRPAASSAPYVSVFGPEDPSAHAVDIDGGDERETPGGHQDERIVITMAPTEF